jgi:hypothetical protein
VAKPTLRSMSQDNHNLQRQTCQCYTMQHQLLLLLQTTHRAANCELTHATRGLCHTRWTWQRSRCDDLHKLPVSIRRGHILPS